MADIYIIAGEPNSGKSCTIRALTGAGRKDSYNIEINGNVVSVYIDTVSLQERSEPTSEAKFIKTLHTKQCKFAIIALRIRQRGGVNPVGNAQAYINALQAANHNIVGIAILGPPKLTFTSVNENLQIQLQSLNELTAANQRAAFLRQSWGFT